MREAEVTEKKRRGRSREIDRQFGERERINDRDQSTERESCNGKEGRDKRC